MPTLGGRGVWISVNPDASMFGIRAREQIKKATAGIKVDVPVTADTKPAIAQVEALKTRMSALNDRLAKLRLTADGKQAEAEIARVQAKMAVLAKTVAKVTMGADTKKLDAQILAKIADLKKLQQQMSGLKMNADDKALTAKILGLERQAAGLKKSLDKGNIKGDINVAAARAKLDSLNASVVLLRKNAGDVTLVADNVSALRNIALVKADIASLQKQARDIRLGGNIDAAGLMAAEASLLGLEAAFGKASEEAAVAKTAMNAFFATSGRGSTFAAAGWKLLTGHITLFGGALNQVLPKMFTSVAVWHLLADAVIELVAVWAPAIIAVTAFGVAGADAAKSIYNRMVAVHTVMDATGQAVPPLTNSFDKLAASVKPEVYQLFGDALVVMGKRGGAFNIVATQTGRVIDQLAARFVFAVTTGGGVNKFMENAVTDVAKLGDSIGNLGGIFGAVFRAVPGYAEILLTVGDAITKVLESATQAAEPVIAVGLALHGFFIYGGAAVTVSLALVASLVKVGAAFGKFNEKITLVGLNNLKKFGSALVTGGLAIAGYGQELLGIAGAEGKAAAGTKVLADAQKLLTKIPTTVWVLAAATALASLVFAIINSRDAAQKFNETLQQTIQNAPLASVVTTIQQAQVVTAARLADSTRKLNTAIKENTVVNAGRAGALNSNGTAIQNLDNATRHYQQGLGQLTDQQKLVTGRFADLGRAYGGNTAALGILNAAGITTAQITDRNRDHWAQALIQVDATARAYAAMGTQAGVLGNDLDVLGRTVTDQAQATKKLNDAWTQFVGDVTGTQGAFDTVAQGFETLSTHSQDLKLSLGKLKTAFKDANDGIDALTPAGIALNQAFGDQVVNIDKLFASWRTAGLAANLFTAGVKDAISPMVRYAKGSQEATAQLVALAQEAGYQGPISLAALTRWLGNTHGATKRLKDITNQATEQEALLTGAMQNQGNFIANKLLADINNAVLAYSGVAAKATAYGKAVAQFGRDSTQAKAAQQKLIEGLIASGEAAGGTTSQIAALIVKITGIPRSQALRDIAATMNEAAAATAKAIPAFRQITADFGLQQKAAAAANNALGLLNAAIRANGLNSAQARDARTKLIADMIQAGVRAKTARTDVANYTTAVKNNGILSDAASQARKKLITDILNASKNARQGRSDLTNYTTAVHDNGSKSDAARSARKKLIDDLVNAGLSAKGARALVDSLQRGIDGMHGKTVHVNFVGSGSGSIAFKESIPGVTLGPSSGGLLGFHAAGGMIRGGTAGKDSVLGMLMPGEVVVPTRMVDQGAVDHLRGKLPGFASGGQVGKLPGGGDYSLSGLSGPGGIVSAGSHYMGTTEAAFGKRVEAAFAAAVIKKFKADMNALAGGGPAIVSYARSFLGKIPYAFGGTGLSKDDCSGFTQAIYSKFGINAPRTSEAQFAWVTRSSPVPGGLAFYVSPGGGPPPGHVAIVQDGNSVISQGGPEGVKGPAIRSLKFLPLMGTGVPKGGFPRSSGGGGNAAIGGAGGPANANAAQAQRYAASRLSAYGWAANQIIPLMALWNQESGWNRFARNPSSGAYGIPQALPASKMGAAANPPTSSAAAQINWGLGYIKGRYGSPAGAEAHEQRFNWYGQGGMVPGYAAGGVTTTGPTGGAAATTALRKLLWTERHGEGMDYLGLRHAFAAGPAKYRTKLTMSELATLDKRQGATQLAYTHLTGAGLTKANLGRLASAARAESTTALDKALNRTPGGHPGWAKGLRYWLGQLSATAGKGLPGGQSTSGPGGAGLPAITHTYGSDIGDNIGAFISSVAPFARGGMAGMARGGMAPSFDKGGVLSPGYNTVWNGLGRDEKLVPAGGHTPIVFQVSSSGNAFDQFMVAWLKKNVRVKGAGNVQKAWGSH